MMTLTTVLAVAGAGGCWYFVGAYHWLTGGDWRRTAAGRHLMAFTATLGALLTWIIVARVWPDWPARRVVSLLLFAALVGQVVWRCVLLHRAQHEREPARR